MNIKSVLVYIMISMNMISNCFGDNIIVIADTHGDLNRFKYILKDAGVLDNHHKWIAPENTTVIQLGDQIDPKSIDKHDISDKHHFKMIYYTNYLETQAKSKNSSFISMIGNHEHMNIDRIRNKSDLKNIIAERPIIRKIDNYIFCHASLKMIHLDILNQYKWTLDDINNLWTRFVRGVSLSDTDSELLNLLIVGNNSIIYTKNADSKENTSTILDTYKVDYMIVGHLVTKHIHLKNRIWYLDQLLKRAFDDNIYNYIQIIDGDIRIKSLKSYMVENIFLSIF